MPRPKARNLEELAGLDIEVLISSKDVMELLGIGNVTLWRYRKQGLLPDPPGGKAQWPLSWILDLMQARRPGERCVAQGIRLAIEHLRKRHSYDEIAEITGIDRSEVISLERLQMEPRGAHLKALKRSQGLTAVDLQRLGRIGRTLGLGDGAVPS